MEEFDCDRCGLDCGDEVYNMNDEFICDDCLTDDELAELEGDAMHRYAVYITPASGVGGEFPEPARRNVSLHVARLYSRACRGLGQRTRIERMDAKGASEKATQSKEVSDG